MTDIVANLGAQRLAGQRARHRHGWRPPSPAMLEDGDYRQWCPSCGVVQDEALSRRGRNARKRGNGRELELARALGAQKVGHFGGPQDVQSDLLVIQSKVRANFPRWMTAELAKLPRTGGRIPTLIVTDSPGRGIGRSTIVVMTLADFQDLHGRIRIEEET